jgi:hypothetical protein
VNIKLSPSITAAITLACVIPEFSLGDGLSHELFVANRTTANDDLGWLEAVASTI